MQQFKERPKTATIMELGTSEKQKFNPRIDPEKRVAKEDYFRTVKDLQ